MVVVSNFMIKSTSEEIQFSWFREHNIAASIFVVTKFFFFILPNFKLSFAFTVISASSWEIIIHQRYLSFLIGVSIIPWKSVATKACTRDIDLNQGCTRFLDGTGLPR